MKNFILIISLIFLIACTTTSKEELEAIQELSLYGGEITISNGSNVSMDKGTIKYKKIDLRNSRAVEERAIDPEILASKIAITIFTKLKSKNRDFDFIEVNLISSDGNIYYYNVSKKKLEIMESEFIFANEWLEKIKSKKFDESYNDLNIPSPILPGKTAYVNKFEHLTSKFGNIDSIWFDGFVHENVTDSTYNGEIHQFIYDLKSQNGVYAIHILINPEDKHFKIYGISFDE